MWLPIYLKRSLKRIFTPVGFSLIGNFWSFWQRTENEKDLYLRLLYDGRYASNICAFTRENMCTGTMFYEDA